MSLRVAITGGNGNLGQKIARRLLGKAHVLLIDDYSGFCAGVKNDPSSVAAFEGCLPDDSGGSFEHVDGGNLCGSAGEGWRDALCSADAVIHLQAHNPYPEASWEDSAKSMEMTANVAAAAGRSDAAMRLVFASSNHVMGRYWREGPDLAGGGVVMNSSTPPNPGTAFSIPSHPQLDATPYSAAKLSGESMCRAAAHASVGGSLSAVVVRIGWCQPGVNTPDTMSVTGTPTIQEGERDDAEAARYSDVALGFDDGEKILAWFQNMWLSNRDCGQLMERAVLAELGKGECLTVNGMSRNSDMRWSDEGWSRLGYEPRDDVANHT